MAGGYWISVKDRFPEDGEFVDCKDTRGQILRLRIVYEKHSGAKFWMHPNQSVHYLHTVTHWRPV